MPYIQFSDPVKIDRPRTLPILPKTFSMKSLFSDNSLVCYKPGSLAPGGVGTVKNSRHKAKFT
jgi:hypothetical protein